MSADQLAAVLLALATQFAQPGRSPYSLIPLPECGNDPLHPTCEVKPVCPEAMLWCQAPRFSRARRSWVRIESAQEARARYAVLTQSLAATTARLLSCQKPECEPLGWTGTRQQLALAGLTVALHESGLREDIQFGRPPLGRGLTGEACLMQVDTREGPKLASWIPPSQREAITASHARREAFARRLLGDSKSALSHCFELGLRMLARARRSCEKSADWTHGMFSMYGTGTTCRATVLKDRTQTFERLLAAARLRAAGRPQRR